MCIRDSNIGSSVILWHDGSNVNSVIGPVAADELIHMIESCLLYTSRVSAAQLDEIVSLMTETLCSGKETISVGGEEHPAGTVKEPLKRLTSEHIEYVLLCMRRTTGPIRNIRRYLLTACLLYTSRCV